MGEAVSPTAALLGHLQTGSLDQALDVSGQAFAQQVYTERLSGESNKTKDAVGKRTAASQPTPQHTHASRWKRNFKHRQKKTNTKNLLFPGVEVFSQVRGQQAADAVV